MARKDGSPPVEGPKLVPMYGSSMEPLRMLRCQSIHPCRACRASGFIQGQPCESCNGTGIGKIRKGSLLYCEVCSKSGMDHLPIMKRDPATDPKPEPKNAMPDDDGKSRKERRRSHVLS